ncbi:MAG: hypothetical protein R3C56_02635 [Pirellulaceae bacterium]
MQEFLPLVAQATVREQMVDFVGLGRMVLSYPGLPCDTLCWEASRCERSAVRLAIATTASRKGLISGCYPLDEHYKQHPEREKLNTFKQE